jgi:hypothetical protein
LAGAVDRPPGVPYSEDEEPGDEGVWNKKDDRERVGVVFDGLEGGGREALPERGVVS